MDIRLVDAFDLPEWLGTQSVTWSAGSSLGDAPLVEGALVTDSGEIQQLDLFAVDAAYPLTVCPDDLRRAAHQAWQFGQVALLQVNGRVACAVPCIRFDADLVCESMRRVAKSVGAPAKNFTVAIAL